MYRHLLFLVLCQAVAPAPQAISDSDITYVKLQPPIDAPTATSQHRESRIENLPLTIPGNITFEVLDKNLTEKRDESTHVIQTNLTDSDVTLPESSNLSEITALPDGADLPEITNEKIVTARSAPEETDLPQELNAPELTVPEKTALPETVAIPSAKAGVTVLPERTLPERTEESYEILEAHGSDVADTIPAETFQSERRGRTYDSSETTDIFDEATERYEDRTKIPEIELPKAKATPKFVPKLSYFQKPQVFASFPTNSIEKSARRHFRSHCSCEKIWNCHKLQISVHRCPDEYFLCCL